MTKRQWFDAATCLGLPLFLVALLLPQLQSHGPWKEVQITELLRDPIAVVDWDEQGLWLEDGRLIRLPDVTRLPLSSFALNAATSQGVEVDHNGRVIGLVRVHRWCGNDPIREHTARVDLSHLLLYTQEADLPDRFASLKEMRQRQSEFVFSEYGWRVGNYFEFHSWSELAAAIDHESSSPHP